jgi:hypothetical protein
MMGKGGTGDIEFAADVPDYKAVGMSGQQKLHNSESDSVPIAANMSGKSDDLLSVFFFALSSSSATPHISI